MLDLYKKQVKQFDPLGKYDGISIDSVRQQAYSQVLGKECPLPGIILTAKWFEDLDSGLYLEYKEEISIEKLELFLNQNISIINTFFNANPIGEIIMTEIHGNQFKFLYPVKGVATGNMYFLAHGEIKDGQIMIPNDKEIITDDVS